MTDTAGSTPRPRVKEFRVGVVRERDDTSAFRSLAKIVFVRDGGLIVAPGPVPDAR